MFNEDERKLRTTFEEVASDMYGGDASRFLAWNDDFGGGYEHADVYAAFRAFVEGYRLGMVAGKQIGSCPGAAGGLPVVKHTSDARLMAELLAALKDTYKATALARYALQLHPDLVDQFDAILSELGVEGNFGKRAQEAIAKAEGK
jgi:hypothetical protein